MSIPEFLILIGVFIAIMLVFRYAGRFIKTLQPKTVKIINWAGFAVAALGGVAWYLFANGIYMIATLLGVIVYFLFYSYDTEEKNS